MFGRLWWRLKRMFGVKETISIPKAPKPKLKATAKRWWTRGPSIQSIADDTLMEVAMDVAFDVTDIPPPALRK